MQPLWWTKVDINHILMGGQAGEGAAERLTYVRPALQSWERRPRSHGRRANEPHRT